LKPLESGLLELKLDHLFLLGEDAQPARPLAAFVGLWGRFQSALHHPIILNDALSIKFFKGDWGNTITLIKP